MAIATDVKNGLGKFCSLACSAKAGGRAHAALDLTGENNSMKVGLEKALDQLHRPDDHPDRAATRRYLELLLDAAV